MIQQEMEAMNSWLSFPMHDSFNQDYAIRRFCPARIEQQQGEWEEEAYTINEIELYSPSDHISPEIPSLQASEEEQFVDSFFNMDSYDKDIKIDHFQEKNEAFDHFDDNLENFSLSIADVYGDIPMMVEEMSSSCEDVGVIAEMVPNSSISIGTSIGTSTIQEEVSHGVDQGLHLVHLLLACAEAVGCRDTQLADSMLSQIWSSVSPWGDSLQRVSYCFAMGLKSRLSLLYNVKANGTLTNGVGDVSLISKEEKIEAFRLLHQATPYIDFGFMAANEAIFQAAEGEHFLHIIDLGMEDTLQYPSLVRMLASRTGGPPKLVRITGISGEMQDLSAIEYWMHEIIDEAKLLGVALKFCRITEPATPSLLTKENLDLREGEALFVNSIMHLHKYVKESRGSLKTILQAIKKLRPTLLTVVEQDANHNGPFFLGRFLESLHYYSAIFDSLEASLPRNSPQRMKIEKLHFAEEIRNIVAYEGIDRIERHERADQWRRQLGRAGFQGVGLKCSSQARLMISAYESDGYTLATDKGCLLLGWKGRPIMLASAWQVHNVSSS